MEITHHCDVISDYVRLIRTAVDNISTDGARRAVPLRRLSLVQFFSFLYVYLMRRYAVSVVHYSTRWDYAEHGQE